MTDKPEHCYMCDHRAEIEQGDFYCGLDEKNHCLLGADFPTDCPLQKGGQMKPVKGKIRHLIKQADALMSGYCKLLKMAGILVRMIHKAMNADGCFILFSDKTGPSIVAYHKFLNTTYWEVHINGTQTNIEYESEAIK